MIKVLHLYDNRLSTYAHFVNSLTSAMPNNQVETDIVNSNDAVMDRCRQWKPDIVHLHGSIAPQLPQGVRLVVTPHGENTSVSGAYVIVARSQMECKRLKEAGLQRVEIVLNPIITRTISFKEAADQYCAIYRRVMDSNVRQLMSDDTLHMLHLLLKAAIMGDRRWVESSLESHAAPDWRQLFIYARLENISEELQRGIAITGLSAPAVDASGIKVFLPDGYELPEQMVTTDIGTLLNAVGADIADKKLPLCHIVALHKLLANSNLDEDKLMAELENRNKHLLERLLHIAQHETLLDEGFMPSEALNDRTTKKIYQLLTNNLQI